MNKDDSILLNDSTLPPDRRPIPQPSRRRKIGVKKGFGLHDWNRLLKTAKDLAQRKGQPYRKIGLDEIARHDDVHDAWIALHGKVYNITPYLHYHPGGVAIMEQCLGKDATALFEKYHRWVNIHGLIGPLVIGDLDVNLNISSNAKEDNFHFSMPAPRPPRKKPIPSLLDSSKNSVSSSNGNVNNLSDEEDDLNPWDKDTQTSAK